MRQAIDYPLGKRLLQQFVVWRAGEGHRCIIEACRRRVVTLLYLIGDLLGPLLLCLLMGGTRRDAVAIITSADHAEEHLAPTVGRNVDDLLLRNLLHRLVLRH